MGVGWRMAWGVVRSGGVVRPEVSCGSAGREAWAGVGVGVDSLWGVVRPGCLGKGLEATRGDVPDDASDREVIGLVAAVAAVLGRWLRMCAGGRTWVGYGGCR